MATHTIFGTGAPSGLTAGGDSTAINVGMAFNVTGVSNWSAIGARVYIPSGTSIPSTGYNAYLWVGADMASATRVAAVAFGTVLAGRWNQVLFDAPILLDPALTYWVTVYLPSGGYGAKANVFTNKVNATDSSPLSAPSSATVNPSNNAYSYAGTGLPTMSASPSATWYGVDILTDDGLGGGSTADLVSMSDTVTAVRSGGPGTTFVTGTATDPLGVTATDAHSVSLSGSTVRTVRRSMWEDRTSLSSMQFNDSTLGPGFIKEGLSNEFGVGFDVERNVKILGANIYKAPACSGTVTVTLWTGGGTALASTVVNWTADAGGWREILFASPVEIAAGSPYVMSYFSPNGESAQNAWVYNDMDYYEYPFHVPRLIETANGKTGAARVASQTESAHKFPTLSTATNYYVDPIASWIETTPASGPGYFNQFPNGGSSFGFPVGVFFADPEFLVDYASIGVNTACGIPISRPDYRAPILASGMDIYASTDVGTVNPELVQADPALGARVKGYFIHDEPDMVHNGAPPEALWADLQDIRRIDSTRPIVLNLGKWPAQSISYQWWPVGATVQETTANWRAYAEVPDVISCDWYTITGVARTGIWCYPKMIQKMRQLSHGRLPVWGYVETCPTEGSNPNPDQVKRATWACLIAGANGIVFFDHRFASVEFTQDFASLLHTPDMRQGVTELCAEIQSVSGPLNAAPLDLVTNVSSSNVTAGPMGGTYGVPIHQTSRSSGAFRYVFAQAIRPGNTTGTFTVPAAAGKTITVLGESRTLSANGSGVFTDDFDNGDYTYHLYRWTA